MVKVVEHWPGWWRLPVLFVGGALAMALSIRLRDTLSITRVLTAPGGTGSYTIWVGELALDFVTFPAILVWLSFSEQRVRRACLEAIVFAAGTMAVLSAYELWKKVETPAYIALIAVGTILLWVAIRLAGLWLVRSFVRQVVIQTGSLCQTCGYDLTGNDSGVCPECGSPVPNQEPGLLT